MPSRQAIIGAVAFASGFAALLYQMVWMRWFQVLFGSSAYAASATLCAFFAGLAIGAECFGRRSSSVTRPLVAYALLEAGAAILALGVPFVFGAYDAVYPYLYSGLADVPLVFVFAKFALAMLVMLPPSILLGGIFPLLAAAHVSDMAALGKTGARLYAINTLGSAAGSAFGALWLPDWIGVRATYGLAIAISLGAACIALVVSRMQRELASVHPGVELESSRSPASESLPRGAMTVIAFSSGFGTLALEVLLIHAIAQRLEFSVYSFGAVMVVVLLCLGVGAHLASLTTRWVSARALLSTSLFAMAGLLWLLPMALEHYRPFVGVGGLARGLHAALVLGGPPLLIGSLVLPLLFRSSGRDEPGVGRQVGRLLAINTLGGILGSLIASFIMLGQFGLAPSIALVGLGYGVAGIAIASDRRGRLLRGCVLTGVFAGVVASSLNPWALPRVELASGDVLVELREGPYGVVSVIDSEQVRRMKINNHYTLSGAGPRGPVKERAGHIPLLLHADPKRVLFIGTATGHTAGAAVVHPVSEIVLVEIVPEVQDLAAIHFARSNRDVYHDPRTRRIAEDGRNFIRATRETFDVIVADLFAPSRPGAGSLYALEHFKDVRDRLAPDGVFCQWLPVYQHDEQTFATVASTFLQVFPEALVVRGDFYRSFPRVALIGHKGEPRPIARINERVRGLVARGVTDRWITNPKAFWMLYVGPLAQLSAELLQYPVSSDALPRFEFLAGRANAQDIRNFLFGTWPRWTELLVAGVAEGPAYRSAAGASKIGLDLARLNALEQAANRKDYDAEIRELRESLPSKLYSPPDPSALDMKVH